jgi:hypothetical protein
MCVEGWLHTIGVHFRCAGVRAASGWVNPSRCTALLSARQGFGIPEKPDPSLAAQQFFSG